MLIYPFMWSLVWRRGVYFGGYNIEAFINMSLRLESLLNPIIGFSLNRVPQSGLLLMIFQLLCG